MTVYSKIIGTGSYLPAQRVTNHDLAAQLAAKGIETSDEWIVTPQRHLGAPLCRRRREARPTWPSRRPSKALEAAGLDADADRPDHRRHLDARFLRQLPEHRLHRAGQAGHHATTAPPSTWQAVCSGFVYALSTADAFIKAGNAQERAGDRHRSVFAHPRLQRPHHLRAVRRRRRRGGDDGIRRAGRAGGQAARRRQPRRHPVRPGESVQRRDRRPEHSCTWMARRCSSWP